MKGSTRYAKIVEWSEEDQCFVGSSTEATMVPMKNPWLRSCARSWRKPSCSATRTDGPLPPPVSGRDSANKMHGLPRRKVSAVQGGSISAKSQDTPIDSCPITVRIMVSRGCLASCGDAR